MPIQLFRRRGLYKFKSCGYIGTSSLCLADPNPPKRVDFGYLSLDNIEIAIDSLYNRGSEICVPIKQLAFTERSGIAVTRTQGTFTMDSTGISLQKFQMNTALSEISAQIKAGNGIFTKNSQTPVEARLQAKLAIGDIIRVLPEYDNYTRGLLLSTGFLSNISMTGKLGDLNLEKADISLPGTFACQATGNVQNLHEADRINGKSPMGASPEKFAGLCECNAGLPKQKNTYTADPIHR